MDSYFIDFAEFDFSGSARCHWIFRRAEFLKPSLWRPGILSHPLLEAAENLVEIFRNNFLFVVCDSSSVCRAGTCGWFAARGNGLQALSFYFADRNDGGLYLGSLDSLQTCGRADDEVFQENQVCVGRCETV